MKIHKSILLITSFAISLSSLLLLSPIIGKVHGAGEPGSVDTTFSNFNTGADLDVNVIAVQEDGKILIGGWFDTYDGHSANYLARLNSDGSYDETFDTSIGADDGVYDIEILDGGKILISGDFSNYNNVARRRIARLNSDGSLDDTFVPVSEGFIQGNCIDVQSDGKIIIASPSSSKDNPLARTLTRLNADGTLDETFLVPLDFGGVNKVVVLPNDKIIIVGWFHSIGGVSRNGIAKLNSDGTLDTTFMVNGLGTDSPFGMVEDVSVQSDGKIWIGGTFTSFDNVERNQVAKLNADGTLDTSFVPVATNAIEGTYIYAIEPQPDGKLLAGGLILKGTDEYELVVRYNTDGTLDSTFSTASIPTDNEEQDYVMDMELLPEGKALVGGYFTVYNEGLDNLFQISLGEYEVLSTPPTGSISINGNLSSIVSTPAFVARTRPTVSEEVQESTTEVPEIVQKVTIIVLDKSGNPVNGAFVQLETGQSGYTDSLGTIDFPVVQEGNIRINVSYKDSRSESQLAVLGQSDNGISKTITLDTTQPDTVADSSIGPKSNNTWYIVGGVIAGISLLLVIIYITKKNN